MAKKRNLPIKELDDVFRIFKILEQLGMNKSETVKQVGINRSTLYRLIDKHWDQYLQHKKTIQPKLEEIEAKRLVLAHNLDSQLDSITADLDLVRAEMQERLLDPDRKKKISNRDLIRFYEILAPYVAEKKGLIGNVPDKDNPNITNWTQKIVNHISTTNIQNNMDNGNK